MTRSLSFVPSRLRVSDLLEKHFDTAFAAPGGIARLRELILTLAMQGKLVEQDPNDPPASELLKEIEKEKASHEGTKTRRGKENKLPPIKPEEVPYELPQGWEWVRLPACYFGVGNKSNQIQTKDYRESGKFPVVDQGKNFITGYYDDESKLLYIDRPVIVFGDHTKNIKFVDFDFIIGADGVKVLCPFKSVSTKFLYRLIQSFDLTDRGYARHFKVLNEKLAPLPPLPEQHRIVARIDQLMARCDALERLRKERDEKRLAVHAAAIKQLLDPSLRAFMSSCEPFAFLSEHFGELYTVKENVAELRKAILQLAVMGCLVPQDPNDTPASELLKEIEAEKQRLVKAGTIKKPKPLPPIKLEEVPYELPQGWEWVMFFDPNTVKSELVSARDYPDDNQIAPDSIEKDTGRLLFHRTVAESGATGPNNRFYEGQILYSKIRPSLNKVVIAPYDGLCSADMYPIICHADTEFMLKAILSEPFLAQVRLAENRVKMPKLNLESLGQFVIPLPPLPEQHRIVARIDQLMALCDRLDQQIDAASGKQSELLDAVMAQV